MKDLDFTAEAQAIADNYDNAMQAWVDDLKNPWKINRVLEVMDENQSFFKNACKNDLPKDIRKNFKRAIFHIRVQRKMIRVVKWFNGLERQTARR